MTLNHKRTNNRDLLQLNICNVPFAALYLFAYILEGICNLFLTQTKGCVSNNIIPARPDTSVYPNPIQPLLFALTALDSLDPIAYVIQINIRPIRKPICQSNSYPLSLPCKLGYGRSSV